MLAGTKRTSSATDGKDPRKFPKLDEAPPPGTILSRAYIPTTGPCYETPLDLRVPLHWSSILFSTMPRPYQPQSIEVSAAKSAVCSEFEPLGVFVTLKTAIEVPHVPGTKCPPFFHVEIQDDTKWDTWKDIQGTVFKTITKHFAHLEGFSRPVVRWNVASDNPYCDWDLALMDTQPPQRPPASTAART